MLEYKKNSQENSLKMIAFMTIIMVVAFFVWGIVY